MIKHTSSETDGCPKLNKEFTVLRNLKFVRVSLWGSRSMDYGKGTLYLDHVAKSPLETEEELFSCVRE
jgi:hypothetical protein